MGYERTLKAVGFGPGETREGTLVYVLKDGTETGTGTLELIFREVAGINLQDPTEKIEDSFSYVIR